MRVITLNLNGIRSATNKGVVDWLRQQDADILCLQEVRANPQDIPKVWQSLGYHSYYYPAEKAGYSGVAISSKIKPKKVSCGFECAFNHEARWIKADFTDYSIASVYVPSGSSGDIRQALKMQFLQEFETYLKKLKKKKRELIFCGDINIAHKKIDLKNWKSNLKNSGFLPEEREWLDKVLDLGFVDTFRYLVGTEAEHYSWWSNRGKARENNVGWRLDYQFSTEALAKTAYSPAIYKDPFFSDHAPVVIDYAL
jgi:exodeoxyribonuclease III